MDHKNKEFICQHGKNECYGNKIHACAIRDNPPATYVDFLACDASSSRPYDDTIAEEVYIQYKFSLIILSSNHPLNSRSETGRIPFLF